MRVDDGLLMRHGACSTLTPTGGSRSWMKTAETTLQASLSSRTMTDNEAEQEGGRAGRSGNVEVPDAACSPGVPDDKRVHTSIY